MIAMAMMSSALVVAALPASAATTVIDDGPTCQAGGGTYTNSTTCTFSSLKSVAPGDTLQIAKSASLANVFFKNNGLTVNGTLGFSITGLFIDSAALTNSGTTNISDGLLSLRNAGSANTGVINIANKGVMELYVGGGLTNAVGGSIVVEDGGLFIVSTFDAVANSGVVNNGEIRVRCGGRVSIAGRFTGNPVVYDDCTPPSVTVEQAVGQSDPTSANSAEFTVKFSEPVERFGASDVTLSLPAGVVASVTVTGGPTIFTVKVIDVVGVSAVASASVSVSVPAGRVADLGKNLNSASTSTDNTVTIVFDRTAPVITPVLSGPMDPNAYWFVGDVSLTWTVVDAESTASSKTGCDPSTVTTDTAGTTFTCQATSKGGTDSRSVTVRRDATAPVTTFTGRTAPNGAGWNATAVTVNWSCGDVLSGPVAVGTQQTLSADGPGQSATGTCSDYAGNTSSDTQTGINIDRTVPVLAPTASPSTVTVNGIVSVLPNASDVTSGVASSSCMPVDTSTAGVKTVPCTATDVAGNAASGTVQVTVTAPVVSWSGFFGSLAAPSALKPVSAGSTVPAIFSLGSNRGMQIFSVGFPRSQQVDCVTGAPKDTAAAAKGNLTYDPLTTRYTFTWATDKKWAGQCRVFTVKFVDGGEYSTSLRFK